MLRIIIPLVILLASLAVVSPSQASGSWQGPFEVTNQSPLMLPLLAPVPTQATLLEKGRTESFWNLSYSNTYQIQSTPGWDIGLDMEIAQLTFQYSRGVSENVEIGSRVPLLAFTGGFMDGILHSYHAFLGMNDYRTARPFNTFLYYLRRNGQSIILPVDGQAGLGDISFYTKVAISRNDPAMTLQLTVEAPTGDARKGFGNGSWDYGITLLAEKQLTRDQKLYFNLGYTFPGDWIGYDILPLHPYKHGLLAWEDRFDPLSIVLQVQVIESPFPATGIWQVDNSIISCTGGIKFALSENRTLSLSMTEDLNASNIPDVSINLSLKDHF